MKNSLIAAVLAFGLATGAATAQNLQPQMSAQDIEAQLEPDPSHLIVPIFMMIVLLLTTGRGGNMAVVAAG